MKVAVSSNGKNLDARLDPGFGSCQFFLIVNPADMSFTRAGNVSQAETSFENKGRDGIPSFDGPPNDL